MNNVCDREAVNNMSMQEVFRPDFLSADKADRSLLADTNSIASGAKGNEGDNYPVAIAMLGRFQLLLDGEPCDFGRKAPRRPLELLKLIVAQGGREVSISRLISLMWPEAEGDNAAGSFDATLHRLRKILNDKRIIVLRDGKISLDRRYCWVDVWVFERLVDGVRRVLRSVPAGDRQDEFLDVYSGEMMKLYQGHFLSGEEVTAWSVSTSERLRYKYIHALIETGRYWESHGNWERAIECYQKGIDVDDLVEVFYQRLMNCYLETERLSESMMVYRRCRQVMSVVLGLQPEGATGVLYSRVKAARVSVQSA